MAIPVTIVLADVLLRIRDASAQSVATDDPPTTSSGTDFVYSMMTVAQLYVNLAERLVVAQSYLQLAPNVAIYDLAGTLTDYCGKLVGVNVSSVAEVDGPVDYRALGRSDRKWMTTLAPTTLLQPLAWAPIGKTLVAFVPTFAQWTLAVPVNPPTVTLSYLQRLPTITQAQQNVTTLAVPDYASEHVARLTELLCLLKTRQLTNFKVKLASLTKDMQLADKFAATGAKAD